MGLASSIGFYCICLICWNKKIHLKAILYVILLEIFYMYLVIFNLSFLHFALMPINRILSEVVITLIMVLLIPLELIYFHALSLEMYNQKTGIMKYMRLIIRKHGHSFINWFLIIFVTVLILGTLGLGSLDARRGAYPITLGILFLGNPCLDFFDSILSHHPFWIIWIQFVVCVPVCVLELMYIMYIDRKCLDNGTKENSTN